MGRHNSMGKGGGSGCGRGGGNGRNGGRGRGMGVGIGAGQHRVNGTFGRSTIPLGEAFERQAVPATRPTENVPERISPQPGGNVAVISADECIGCGICADVCPSGAIAITKDIAVVTSELCTGCGACVDECPNSVIELNAQVS